MSAPLRREWVRADDDRLLTLRASGLEWSDVAVAMHITRNAAVARHARVLRRRGLARTGTFRVGPAVPVGQQRKEPLPAGHPESWGAITAGTLLEGSPYPVVARP